MMPGILYVVATPLGNLEDLSARALRILGEVDRIACEDTRHTRKLLTHFGLSTPTTSFHEHNQKAKTPRLMALLRKGDRLALVSDAGTPLLSDPGYLLVRACREERITVFPIPGPSAAVAALCVSGLPTECFFFAGFLPRRAQAQRLALQGLSALAATLVFYLSPHGLLPTIERMLEVLGDRQAFLAREMTKLHESHYFETLGDLLETLKGKDPRGEYTLVVEGASEKESPAQELDAIAYVEGLRQIGGLSRKEAIRKAASDLGLPRREIYQQVMRHLDRFKT